MIRHHLIVLLCSFLSIGGICQDNTGQEKKDGLQMQYVVDRFLQANDKPELANRRQEYVVMIFEVNVSGKVKNIHLLADLDNLDKTYSILKQIRPECFEDKTFSSFAGKFVNMAVYSLTEKQNYVARAVIDTKEVIKTRNAILIDPLYYSVSQAIKETPPDRIIHSKKDKTN